MKLIKRKSNRLLQYAKEIFGNEFVINAYIQTYKFDRDFDFEIQEDLDRVEQSIDMDGYTKLGLDSCGDYIIEFSNGKMLKFSTTETFCIEVYKDDEDVL